MSVRAFPCTAAAAALLKMIVRDELKLKSWYSWSDRPVEPLTSSSTAGAEQLQSRVLDTLWIPSNRYYSSNETAWARELTGEPLQAAIVWKRWCQSQLIIGVFVFLCFLPGCSGPQQVKNGRGSHEICDSTSSLFLVVLLTRFRWRSLLLFAHF